MVGEAVVEHRPQINALPRSAGKNAPLRQKGNFELSPHRVWEVLRLTQNNALCRGRSREGGSPSASVGAAVTQSLRHYCRNPRCRSKLSARVSNPREAFCARGCHSSFYRKRCVACEQPMERKRESQQLCGRRKCEGQFKTLKAHMMLGRHHPSTPTENAGPVNDPGAAVDASGNPIKPGTFSPLKIDRAWRQVAGQSKATGSFALRLPMPTRWSGLTGRRTVSTGARRALPP